MKRFRMQVTIVTRDDSLIRSAHDMRNAVERALSNDDEVCAEETVLLVETAKKTVNDFQDTNWNSITKPGSERASSHVDAWYEAAKLFAEGD